jgi:tetratricopeptide (TPR) repeat protein
MRNLLFFLFVTGISALNGLSQVPSGRGAFYLNELQFGRAKTWFKDQLKKSPDDIEAFIGLGDTYLALNITDSAKMAFQKAVKLNPKNPYALAGLGKVALLNNDRLAQTDYFDRARRADKLNPEVYCAIAEGCLKLSRQDTVTALIFLNQGLSINPKYAGLHISTGNLEICKKNYGLAANAFDRAVFFDPKSATAYRNLGQVYTISRAYRDALKAFNQSIEINTNQVLVYKYLGDLFYTLGKYPEGEKAYKTYLSRAEASTDDCERYAILLFFNNKYHEASEQLEKVIAVNKDESILLRIRGYIACETGDYKNGLEYMDQFFRLHDPKKIIATDYIYYARILQENGKANAARDNYLKAISLDPSKTDLYQELAILSSRNKMHNEAAGYYKKMAESGSDQVVSFFQAGKEYYFEGENWKARFDSLKERQKTGTNDSTDGTVEQQKMRYNYSLADSAFTVVTRLSPEYAGGFIWKGRMQSLLFADAENTGSKDAYEQALTILEKGDRTKNSKMIIECYKYLGSWYWLGYEKYLSSDKQKSAEMRAKSGGFFTQILELDPSDRQAKEVTIKMREGKQ